MILHCIYVYKKSNIQRCFPWSFRLHPDFPTQLAVTSINHQKPTKVPLPAHLLQFHVILLEYPAFRVKPIHRGSSASSLNRGFRTIHWRWAWCQRPQIPPTEQLKNWKLVRSTALWWYIHHHLLVNNVNVGHTDSATATCFSSLHRFD